MTKNLRTLLLLSVAGLQGLSAPALADETAPQADASPANSRLLLRLGDDAFRHTQHINGIAYSPDGKFIATTANNQPNNGAYVWDAQSGKLVQRLIPETEETHWSTCVAWSPDGKKIAVGDISGNVTVWDASTARTLYCSERHKGRVTSMAFVPQHAWLVTAGKDGRVRVLDANNLDLAEEVHTWSAMSPKHEGESKSTADVEGSGSGGDLAVSVDGKRIAATYDNHIYVWDAESGGLLTTIRNAHSPKDNAGKPKSHSGTIESLCFLEGRLASAGNRVLPRGQTSVKHAFSNIQVLEIKLWDVTTGKLIEDVCQQEVFGFGKMAGTNDGQFLATADANAVHIWKVADRKPVHTFAVPGLWSGPLAFSLDGSRLSVGTGSVLATWDVESGKPQQESPPLGTIHHGLTSAAWSADAEHIALGFGGGVEIWNANSGAIVKQLSMGEPLGPFSRSANAAAVAFSPDGKLLFAAGNRDDENLVKHHIGIMRSWEVASGKQLGEVVAEREVRGMILSADGSQALLATSNGAADDTQFLLYSLASGERVATLPSPLSGEHGLWQLKQMVFGTSGQNVYIVCYDGKLIRWNPTSGSIDESVLEWRREPKDFAGSRRLWIGDAAFTRDGKTVFTSTNEVLCLWETETGKLLRSERLSGIEHGMKLAVSPDGKTLVGAEINYAGSPGTDVLRLWDVASGKLRLTLASQDGRASVFAFSPDSTKLLTGFHKGIAAIWDIR